MIEDEWKNAGQGWQGCSGLLQLMGWKQPGKAIVLRRQIKKDIGVVSKNALTGQALFPFADMGEDVAAYE